MYGSIINNRSNKEITKRDYFCIRKYNAYPANATNQGPTTMTPVDNNRERHI